MTWNNLALARGQFDLPVFPQPYEANESELDDFIVFLEHLSKKLDVLFDTTSDEVQEKVGNFMHTLVAARTNAAQRVVLARISSRARDLMAEMMQSNGVSQRFHVEATPLNKPGDMRWTNGTDGKHDQMTFRTLMPLHYCLDVMKRADRDFFGNVGGIRCDSRAMNSPDTVLYSLRADGLSPLEWEKLGSSWIEIRSLEFALDYTEDMIQFHLYPPNLEVFPGGMDREMLLQRLVDQWADLLTACKRAQMNVEDASAWPPQSHMPWIPQSLMDMPVVAWLGRQC